MHSAVAANASGNKLPCSDNADAFPAPALAILHSPCGMRFGFDPKRSACFATTRCACQPFLMRPWSPGRHLNGMCCVENHGLALCRQSRDQKRYVTPMVGRVSHAGRMQR